jgi:putative hydrolase of the HAD superfamily
MSIDFVAFDLGGVLVDVDLWRAYRHLGRPCEAAFFDGDHHSRVSVGSLDAEGFVHESARRSGHAPERVRRAWRTVVRPFPGANALVASAGPRPVAWSNTDPEHIDALPTLPRALFHEQRGLSYELGAMKPDPAFYRAALDRLGVDAERVAFIDDLPRNVEAARALGVRARRVHGIADAWRALRELGAIE